MNLISVPLIKYCKTSFTSDLFIYDETDNSGPSFNQDAATVTVSPASQAVIQKNTATITCTINNANPAVIEVTWEKVSSGVTTPVTVTGRFNGSTPAFPDLVISDLQPSDAGTYYCSARNAIGTTKSSPGSVLQVTGGQCSKQESPLKFFR